MKIVVAYHSHNEGRLARRGNLNMREILTPLFFPWERQRHPDMKRQRSRRQRSKDLAAARALKRQYVPLCFVPRSVPCSWHLNARGDEWIFTEQSPTYSWWSTPALQNGEYR